MLTASERRAESDDAVAADLSDELRTVWRKVRRFFPLSPEFCPLSPEFCTRTEAFLDWVHDHSADVASILRREDEKAVAALIRLGEPSEPVEAGHPGDETDRRFHEAWEAAPAMPDLPVRSYRRACETSWAFDLSDLPF